MSRRAASRPESPSGRARRSRSSRSATSPRASARPATRSRSDRTTEAEGSPIGVLRCLATVEFGSRSELPRMPTRWRRARVCSGGRRTGVPATPDQAAAGASNVAVRPADLCRQIVIWLGFVAGYQAARGLADRGATEALRNARRQVRLEDRLGGSPEVRLQHEVLPTDLARPCRRLDVLARTIRRGHRRRRSSG
jgi:hypothetical protein